jgi:single-strand DNA-binding protein
MNKFFGIGRLVRDPEVRYTTGENQTAIARFTIAIDRKYKKDGEQSADFINCIAFGKTAEFIEKYFSKGSKIIVSGRVTTGSYTNKEGQKVHTTDITVEEVEFGESKSSTNSNHLSTTQSTTDNLGFMNIPDGLYEELPFN